MLRPEKEVWRTPWESVHQLHARLRTSPRSRLLNLGSTLRSWRWILPGSAHDKPSGWRLCNANMPLYARGPSDQSCLLRNTGFRKKIAKVPQPFRAVITAQHASGLCGGQMRLCNGQWHMQRRRSAVGTQCRAQPFALHQLHHPAAHLRSGTDDAFHLHRKPTSTLHILPQTQNRPKRVLCITWQLPACSHLFVAVR